MCRTTRRWLVVLSQAAGLSLRMVGPPLAEGTQNFPRPVVVGVVPVVSVPGVPTSIDAASEFQSVGERSSGHAL